MGLSYRSAGGLGIARDHSYNVMRSNWLWIERVSLMEGFDTKIRAREEIYVGTCIIEKYGWNRCLSGKIRKTKIACGEINSP